jgi:hypothetical protein
VIPNALSVGSVVAVFDAHQSDKFCSSVRVLMPGKFHKKARYQKATNGSGQTHLSDGKGLFYAIRLLDNLDFP